MEMNKLIELLKNGEDDCTEFKLSFTKDIAKDVCAFSNTGGGFIIIGADDDGRIFGTVDIHKKLSDIMQDIKPFPAVKIIKKKIDEKTIFIVEVKKSDKLHTYRFVAYIRVGQNNRPLGMEEVIEKASESLLINFDSQKCPGSGTDEINKEYVDYYLAQRKSTRSVAVPVMPYNSILLRINAVREDKGKSAPTNAGIMFFSKTPQRHINNSSLRIIRFRDERMAEYSDMREYRGPLWRILEDSWTYLREVLIKKGKITGLKRSEEYEYPLPALREAIINGMVHRNYYINADIRLFIFPDKIKVISPGSFPPGVTPENPKHITRNPVLAQYMYDMGYTERYGSGIIKMRELSAACGIDLKFDVSQLETRVVFSKRRDIKLDGTDKKILAIIKSSGQAKTAVIMKRLKISRDTAVNRLNQLINSALVVKTGKGKNTFYQIHQPDEQAFSSDE